MKIKFLLSFVVSFLFSIVSYGQTTWRGTISTDISNSGNWSNGLPSINNNTKQGIINVCSVCPTLNASAAFNSIKINDGGAIILNNFELTTTTLSITGGTISSDDGKLTTANLSEMRESIFNGDIKITASRGNAYGGNTFNGVTNFEFSNVSAPLNLNTIVGSTYNKNTTFKNASTKTLTIASHSSNSTISNFNAQTTFINEGNVSGGGTINVATSGAIVKTNDIIVQNILGTFSLATGTATRISGSTLIVTNGSTANLLSSSAIGTFNSVSLTNTASNSTITTASATTNNKLNINSGLSVVFASVVNNTINLNKVICGISVPTVTIDVLSSANLTITASTFKDLAITNKSNLNINSSTFKDLSITDNSNASNVVTISTITCLGNFLLVGTNSVVTNILGVNTFNKNITIDKEVNISGVNINNINLVADNQFINSNNNTVISIPRLKSNGKMTINTLVNITNRLTIGGIVDCLSGTLSNPKLHIAGGATISGAGANAFIMGAVKKTVLTAITSTTFLFPVGTIRVGQTPENKYTPLTLLTLTSLTVPLTTDFITVAYVPSASTHPNTNIISGSCEYWGFNSNFDGQCRFSLGTAPNFCTTKDNGTGLSAFHWADNIGNWANINTTFRVANQTITSTNTTTGFVSFKANENNEIALGYGSLLELDLSEVAVKDFIFVGSTSILPSSILPPPPLTNFKSGLGSIFISPKFVGAALNGTLTLKFNNPTTDPISSIIEIPINKTTLLMAGSILKMGINSPPATTIPLDPKLYTITNTPPREATIKFYKLPQTAPSTALGITSNLVNGIRFDTSLTFNFPVVSPSQPQFRLDIIDASNNTPITNITTTLPNLTLTWTPTTLAPGTYKFTLTDLSSSKVYNGQFIKQ